MQLFHYNRRDLIAKMLFDITKLTIIAGCISGFFPAFDWVIKLEIYSAIGITFVLGFIACPRKKEE